MDSGWGGAYGVLTRYWVLSILLANPKESDLPSSEKNMLFSLGQEDTSEKQALAPDWGWWGSGNQAYFLELELNQLGFFPLELQSKAKF